MEEIKKIRHIGESGKNTAEITEQQLDINTPDNKESLGLLRKAGEIVKPFGSTYVGSACIHYFINKFSEKPTYHTASEVTLDEPVNEQFADYGWKELRNALMRSFGRKDKVARKN